MVSKDRSYRVYRMMCITTRLNESIKSSSEPKEIYYNNFASLPFRCRRGEMD